MLLQPYDLNHHQTPASELFFLTYSPHIGAEYLLVGVEWDPRGTPYLASYTSSEASLPSASNWSSRVYYYIK